MLFSDKDNLLIKAGIEYNSIRDFTFQQKEEKVWVHHVSGKSLALGKEMTGIVRTPPSRASSRCQPCVMEHRWNARAAATRAVTQWGCTQITHHAHPWLPKLLGHAPATETPSWQRQSLPQNEYVILNVNITSREVSIQLVGLFLL